MIATRRPRSLKIHSLEALDARITPAGGVPIHPVTAVAPLYAPNGTPMDKLGQSLNTIYQEFLAFAKQDTHHPFVSTQSNVLFRLPAGTTDGIKTQVGVDIQVKGNLDKVVADLKAIGMEVGAVDRTTRIVTGYLPISQLATVAHDAEVSNASPIYKPVSHGPGFGPVKPRFR